jgi:hypothetical protein
MYPNPGSCRGALPCCPGVIEPTPRKHIWVLTRLPVIVNNIVLNNIAGECITAIPEHGLYIRTHDLYSVGAKLQITIDVDGSMMPAYTRLCTVTSIAKDHSKSSLRLKFNQIVPEDEKRIRLSIERMITQG